MRGVYGEGLMATVVLLARVGEKDVDTPPTTTRRDEAFDSDED